MNRHRLVAAAGSVAIAAVASECPAAGEGEAEAPLAPRAASGASEPAAETTPARSAEQRIDFRAGRVDVDLRLQQLRLADDVVVQVDRYRLTSERLQLRRGPSGVELDGEGRVAFCPCPDPPVTVGFTSATVAPPTDVLIEQPTVRVGGVPVLWAPYAWLRSPNRAGMLPPQIAWRGDDGLLLGSGFHLPFGSAEHGLRPAVDLRAAGYIQGGAAIESRLATAHTSTLVRWDHLRENLLGLDTRGVSTRTDGSATAAWSVDAIRGERGRRGTLSLEEAARRYDRAEASVGHFGTAVVAGATLRADAPRGGRLQQLGSVGPRGHFGWAGALGAVGSADAAVDVATAREVGVGSVTLVTHRGALSLDARPGPLAAGLQLRQMVAASGTADAAGALEWGHAQANVGLPLVRDYGRTEDPVVHWVEPYLQVGAGHARGTTGFFDGAWRARSEFIQALVGADTFLGRHGARGAGSLGVSGGGVGAAPPLRPAVGARASARARPAALRADAVWLPRAERGVVASARGRVGPVDSVHLGTYLEGRYQVDPALARWLSPDPSFAPWADWFDREGWTVGSSLAVPWAKWLASEFATDYDLSAASLLSVRGAVGYRHPCGCLAAVAWAGQRIGRPGTSAWLMVDLAP